MNPTVVVVGVNSSEALLIWEFIPSSNFTVGIYRQNLGDTQFVQIASRAGTLSSDSPFNMDQSFKAKYDAKLPATLVLKNVKQNEEFVYRLTVLTDRGVQKLRDDVTIDVVGELGFLVHFLDYQGF